MKYEYIEVEGRQVKPNNVLYGKKTNRKYDIECEHGILLATSFDSFNENGIPTYWTAEWHQLSWDKKEEF